MLSLDFVLMNFFNMIILYIASLLFISKEVLNLNVGAVCIQEVLLTVITSAEEHKS